MERKHMSSQDIARMKMYHVTMFFEGLAEVLKEWAETVMYLNIINTEMNSSAIENAENELIALVDTDDFFNFINDLTGYDITS